MAEGYGRLRSAVEGDEALLPGSQAENGSPRVRGGSHRLNRPTARGGLPALMEGRHR